MGTISERKRKDGSKSYTAQIRIKRGGTVVHTEAQTFDRKPAASAWLKRREAQLAEPGALDKLKTQNVTLSDAITRYLKDSRRAIGRTKAQCLDMIQKHRIAEMRCEAITSKDISEFAVDLQNGWHPDGETAKRKPQTVGNYMSHLGAIFAVARPMWGFQLDYSAFKDAAIVVGRMGVTAKSGKRERVPTLDELDAILDHFEERQKRVPHAVPMVKVVLFALFSTRRQEEITRIRWDDYEPKNKRVLVRDMKNPGQKIGNDVWCALPDEAVAIIESMPRTGERIFPFGTDAISAAFTRATRTLGIKDLTFHDLRHAGASRLFEMGWDIPHAATVTGHRSWSSLKRYTHIRQFGDRYEGWKWKP